jgi:hypothetical protein
MSQSPAPSPATGPSNAVRFRYVQARAQMMDARRGMHAVVDKQSAKVWILKFKGVVVRLRFVLYGGWG